MGERDYSEFMVRVQCRMKGSDDPFLWNRFYEFAYSQSEAVAACTHDLWKLGIETNGVECKYVTRMSVEWGEHYEEFEAVGDTWAEAASDAWDQFVDQHPDADHASAIIGPVAS